MKKEIKVFMDNVKDLSKRIYHWAKSPVFRVHILKIVTAGLFVVLALGAYMVHMVYADQYEEFRNITTTANLRRDVSRGVISDRYGVMLVANNPVSVITYRHIPNTSAAGMRQVAYNLSTLIDIENLHENNPNVLTRRDRQDLFIFLHPDIARELVPIDERSTDPGIFHQQMIDQVTDEHLLVLTEDELRAHAIFLRMNQGAGMTTNIIKTNPTELEVALVTENLRYLPGIDIAVDWEREYPSDLNRDIFGYVSTRHQGIPRDREAYFLSQGYASNARVGTSQLERVLQTHLSGFQYRYFIDDGEETLLTSGMPGFNVSLNLDSELQLIVEEIVTELLIHERETQPLARFLREANLVISDPNTGAVLAMVGVIIDEDDDGELSARMNPLGTIHRASSVGSAIKGASLMAGYYYGMNTPGQVRLDRPLHFRGSPVMRSWTNMNLIDDTTALIRSSNVYFFLQSLDFAGITTWTPDEIVSFDERVWDYYLEFFRQTGLGSRTGIEFPDEVIGFFSGRQFHDFLFFSIGQVDTYTAMQLAQFGAVLATRGDRMQMQIIQNVYMPGNPGEMNQLIQGFEPNLLNRIELTDEQWDVLHDGHRGVVIHRDGTARSIFEGVDFDPAGKTGTSEAFLSDENGFLIDEQGRFVRDGYQYVELYNRTFVAYAPYDNPQIVISVIVPQAQIANVPVGRPNIAAIIARHAMQAYFDLQIERAGGIVPVRGESED